VVELLVARLAVPRTDFPFTRIESSVVEDGIQPSINNLGGQAMNLVNETHSADNNDQMNRMVGRSRDEVSRPIRLRADSMIQDLRMLLMYFEIGEAFHKDFSSFREVSAYFEKRDIAGEHPKGLGAGNTSIQRCKREAQKFFGAHFGLPGPATLFAIEGRGLSAESLTPLGEQAWLLTRNFLRDLRSDPDFD
jgi:hypothetical protein